MLTENSTAIYCVDGSNKAEEANSIDAEQSLKQHVNIDKAFFAVQRAPSAKVPAAKCPHHFATSSKWHTTSSQKLQTSNLQSASTSKTRLMAKHTVGWITII